MKLYNISAFRFLIVSLWVVTLFSFVMGTLISNLFPILILLLCFHFYPALVINRKVVLSLVMFLAFLFSYALFSEVILDLKSDNLLQGIYYFRGGILLAVILMLIEVDERRFYNTLTLLACLTSFVFLLSYISNYFGGIYSIFNLVPDRFLSREYSGFTGMYNNPNYWAIFAFLHFIILLNAFNKSHFSYPSHFLLIIALVISIVSLISTGSRMGIVLALLTVLFGVKFNTKVWFFLFLVFMSFILFVFFHDYIPSWDNGSAIGKSFDRFERLLNNIEEENRFLRAKYYLDILCSSPKNLLLGIGIGNDLEVGPPHNTLILLFRDFGFLILALVIFFLAYLMNMIVKLKCSEKSMYYSYFIAVFVFFISNDVIDSRPFWFIFGLLISAILKERNNIEKTNSYPR